MVFLQQIVKDLLRNSKNLSQRSIINNRYMGRYMANGGLYLHELRGTVS